MRVADECQRQGIKLFFYYSQLDWHHPDYFPRGETGRTTGRPNSGMRVNGTSIYGTRGGPVSPRHWGVTTQRGDTVYVHLFDGPDGALALPMPPTR